MILKAFIKLPYFPGLLKFEFEINFVFLFRLRLNFPMLYYIHLSNMAPLLCGWVS